MARDSQAREDDGEASLIDRRSWLKALGLSVTTMAVSGTASDSARAASNTGYGEVGYGDGGYGGTTESTLTVSTGSATDITDSSVTLNGELTDLGGASSADVGFEIRKVSATTWTATNVQTLSATGTFSTTLNGLSSSTDYEYRAVVSASDGDTATGTIRTFTTQSAYHAPVIDKFAVSESGSPNPHAEISVSWSVSDADADLQTVTLTVTDPSGQVVRSTKNSVGGQSATGTESYKIKQGGGTKYECTLTVTDAQSQTTSQTKSVTA